MHPFHVIHPRYFGLFNPTPIVWGQVADIICARLNPQLAVWSHAPAAVEIELATIRMVGARLGIPDAKGFFTGGGEEANRASVQIALVRAFPSIAEGGLRDLPAQPVFYASAESHLAWLKIAVALGLGRSALRLVPVDRDLKMDVSILREMIDSDHEAGRAPFMVAVTAGTTAAGVIDPLPEIANLAEESGLSFHVDAAWAGAAAFSDTWRLALQGISRADSVTIDAHKWLSQPMGTGILLARHQGPMRCRLQRRRILYARRRSR